MNQIIDQLFRVAIYLRLSKDDGDFSVSGTGKTESNSIHNQRELLRNYLAQHPEMELCGEYKDDGYTGTNFDRPDFQRMMKDIRKGLINCVIVKDLSRFGRDYIDCGKYIEKLFPQLGVRFIAINDHFDTATENSSNSIVIPFKNLINDSYSRDISIKVRSNLAVKREQGEFISNFAVYGYIRNPGDKKQMVIDEYAAGVVRDIFRWKIEGLSPNAIAERLNNSGVLSPMEYKLSKGSRYTSAFKKGTVAEWSHVAVRRILRNEVYTGVLIQGKRTTPNYKTKVFVVKDESEWARTEDAHEAIIKRSDFALVQQLLQEDTRAGGEEVAVHPLSGKMFCADCGAPIVKKTVTSRGKRYVYFICATYKRHPDQCSKHNITEDLLMETVLAIVQKQIALILDLEKALKQIESLTWEDAELRKLDATIAAQERIIEKNSTLRMGIYEDLQDGIITREEFSSMKEEFTLRIDEAKRAVRELMHQKNDLREGLSEKQGWLSRFREFANISALTRQVVVTMIERIEIHEDLSIDVTFRHRDQIAAIYQFLQEQQGQPKTKGNLTLIPQKEVV